MFSDIISGIIIGLFLFVILIVVRFLVMVAKAAFISPRKRRK